MPDDRRKRRTRGAIKSRRPPAAEKAATRLRGRFEQLLRSSISIHGERSLAQVLQRIVDAGREVVGARYAALGVLDDGGEGLREFVTAGLTAAERRRIGDPPRGRGLLGVVIRAARPIRVRNIERHARRHGFPPHHPAMKSFLGVPIVLRGRVFGNLYMTDKLGKAEFSPEDEAIAVLLAAQAAVAVENARLDEETRELLGQVRAMQRQRDLFFAMMNHELRNALTGVYGWAERLVRRRSGDTAQAAREVFEGAERTITLLNNFLDLTRLDAGKVRPVWREVQVRSVVRRAVTGLVPAAEAKQVVLDEEYQAAPAELRTDGMRLEQILVNLVSNAIRHGPGGSAVRVRVLGNGREVMFEVADAGPGIPPEIQDKIFEPFERFDTQSGMGSGLGLPLSRRLAEILGGRLEVVCPPRGGTVFRLTLPQRPPGES